MGLLTVHKTTEEEKYVICSWKYDGEYAIYNGPSYEEQAKTRRGFANPKNNYYSFLEGTQLVGYINLIEEDTQVFFGIGVDPSYCNRGYGQIISKMACDLSHNIYPGKLVYLEVRIWNARAIKCYEKAGFRIIGEPIERTTPIGEGLFVRMIEGH